MGSDKARLDHAERLLSSAEHSSEAEMRNSLSRIYYAVYHVATVVVGSMAHGQFPNALDGHEPDLGRRFKRLFELRNKADYNPGFVLEEYGDLKNFREKFQEQMTEARALYERLLELVSDDA